MNVESLKGMRALRSIRSTVSGRPVAPTGLQRLVELALLRMKVAKSSNIKAAPLEPVAVVDLSQAEAKPRLRADFAWAETARINGEARVRAFRTPRFMI